MEHVLFLAHTEADNTLHKSAHEALSAAKTLAEGLGASLSAGLVGGEVQAAADSIAGCGAEKIFGVSGETFGQSRYATDAAAFEALAKAAGASIVVAPSTSRINRALPGAAQRLGGVCDTDTTGAAASGDQASIKRWFYRQRMVAEMTRTERPWFITIAPGSLSAWEGASGGASVESVAVDVDTRTQVTGQKAPAADEQTIRPDAKLLFVTGAGWTKKQKDGQVHGQRAAQIIKGFLHNASCSLGSSKSLTDMSAEGGQVLPFLSHLNQVGQTGSTPRHPKGLATCCHGEEPHVVGWRFINERRAVNLDANCGWAHGKADVLYVADAFEVMEKVNALLGG
ncbi:electron transfer flavoprotein subunit alpha [Candidatus Sumerlaeota bacterium]|nr:electron transfer flavoprotein subunit alpha [Candidatus Sumerlaeota bacterium]